MIDNKIDTVEPITEVYEKPVKIGVVIGCDKLNVRSEPHTGSDIVCTVKRDAEVVVVDDESTEDFYKVYLASGVEGFCMKRYIAV